MKLFYCFVLIYFCIAPEICSSHSIQKRQDSTTDTNRTSFILNGTQDLSKIFMGIPNHINKQNLLHFELSRVILTPDHLISSLADCPNLETIKLTHIKVRGNFTKRIQLKKLKDFELQLEFENLVTDQEEINNSTKRLKSLVFFDKDSPSWELHEISSLGTNIAIYIHETPIFVINHDDGSLKATYTQDTAEQYYGETTMSDIFLYLGQRQPEEFVLKILDLTTSVEESRSTLNFDCISLDSLISLTLNYKDEHNNSGIDINTILSRTSENLKELLLSGFNKVIIDFTPVTSNLRKLSIIDVTATNNTGLGKNWEKLHTFVCQDSVIDIDMIPNTITDLVLSNCKLIGGTVNDVVVKTVYLEKLKISNFHSFEQKQSINLSLIPKSTIKSITCKGLENISYNNSINDEQFKQLTHLDIRESNVAMNNISFPSSITHLSLHQVRFSAFKFETVISNMDNLIEFHCVGVSDVYHDTNDVIIDLSKLSYNTLKVLDLRYGKIIETRQVNFENLEELNLVEVHLEKNLTSLIRSSLRKLKLGLLLSNNDLDLLKYLKNAINLEKLEIIYADLVDLAILPAKTIRNLQITADTIIQSKDMEFGQLETLQIHGGSFNNISTPFPNSLVDLNLRFHGSVNQSNLCHVLKNVKQLRDVKISLLQDDFDASCIPSSTTLENLYLKTPYLSKTDACTTFPKLESLSIEVDRIDSNLLDNFSATFPNISRITSFLVRNSYSYDLLHQILFHSCIIDVSLFNVERLSSKENPDKIIRDVDNELEKYGVGKNSTVVEIWRTSLLYSCDKVGDYAGSSLEKCQQDSI